MWYLVSSEQQQRVSVNMGTNWSQSKEDSKESGVSFKTDWSTVVIMYLKKKRSSRMARRRTQSELIKSNFLIPLRQQSLLRVRPHKSVCPGTGFGRRGAKRKKSQGRTAHVKETPPSLKEKILEEGMESDGSGVSFKSDRSKDRLINFKDRVSLSGPKLSSSEEEHVVADDEDLVKSSDDLKVKR